MLALEVSLLLGYSWRNPPEDSVWIGKVWAGNVCRRFTQETSSILFDSARFRLKFKLYSRGGVLWQHCKFQLNQRSGCCLPTALTILGVGIFVRRAQERGKRVTITVIHVGVQIDCLEVVGGVKRLVLFSCFALFDCRSVGCGVIVRR